VSTETKTFEVRGKPYTIQRFGLEEGAVVDDLVDAVKIDPSIPINQSLVEKQAITVFYGTIEPKFESIDAVKKMDRETMLHLWVEIRRFNTYETSFLSLLRNSPSPGSQPEGTSPQ